MNNYYSQGQGSLWSGFTNSFTGNLDWKRQQVQNEFNSAEAQKNRDYQTEMSNTAIQRAVSDAQKAGINPALVATSGLSASSPSGSSASSGSGSNSVNGLNAVVSVANSAFKALTYGQKQVLSLLKR